MGRNLSQKLRLSRSGSARFSLFSQVIFMEELWWPVIHSTILPTPSSALSSPSLTPDDDVFKHLAGVYSFNHGRMFAGESCMVGAPNFENGTTNGAAWYPLTGGMQDYNYIWHGCMEVTLELSCCKFPPATELPQFWEDNRQSLLTFLGEAHRGVKGFVKDETFTPIEGASMKVRGRDVGFQTTKEGEFWRILLPGIYTMEVFAEGFAPREVQFAIVEQNPTMLNITLYKDVPRRDGNAVDESEGEPSGLFSFNPFGAASNLLPKLPIIG